jgi:hypothetical protein
VRWLLGHPSVKERVNHRGGTGETALWIACNWGHGGIVRLLLESGADPTTVDNGGTTPIAIAKQNLERLEDDATEWERECVAALEVRLCLPLLSSHPQHLLS